jgi:N-acyl-D-aspartate/D-glutamate deacylase
MYDLLIEGGLVIDGTGSAPRRLDVGVTGEHVTALEPPGAAGHARRKIDVGGQVVAPGFVDIHTHYDAQVFWDPYLTPTSAHGVTTVIGGNCGFSIAPLSADDGGYMLRMLAEVEAIPVAALEAGVPWTWSSFGEYLAAVERVRPALNFGVMAGHSAIRRAVLGDEHTEPEPGPEAVGRMVALLREALGAGALGFSSSWNHYHNDGEGAPVPSRFSPAHELTTLCAQLVDYPGTQVEFIPTVGPFTDEHVETMIAMALAAGRTLNWNLLIPSDPEVAHRQLAVSDLAAERGARIVALTYPGPTPLRTSRRSGIFHAIPEWAELLDRPDAEVLAALGDDAARQRLRAAARATDPGFEAQLGALTVADTHADASARWSGRRVEDVAKELDTDAFDALFELWTLDGLKTGLYAEPFANSEGSWRVRRQTWSDPRVIIGGSDAGAHVQMLATFDYSVVMLALARDSGALELPEVVHRLTEVPARLYGLRDRGTLREGAYADLVVFDPDTVGPGAPGWRDDLPGEAGRIYQEPKGISHVVVNGTEVVSPDGLSEARPGTVLRSGRDTSG